MLVTMVCNVASLDRGSLESCWSEYLNIGAKEPKMWMDQTPTAAAIFGI